MDGQGDGRSYGQSDKQMDGKTDVCTDRDTCMYGQMHMHTQRWVHGHKESQMFYTDTCIDVKTDRCTGRCMYGQMYV